jgi:hypothetical protein
MAGTSFTYHWGLPGPTSIGPRSRLPTATGPS